MWRITGTRTLRGESLGRGMSVDPAMAFGPARGWWSAMKGMLSMDTNERRRLLGSAANVRSP